jgi:hypothetical protein
METERAGTLKKIVSIVAGALLIAGIVAIFALPRPEQRHYPKRIQVRFWHMWTSEWARKVSDICDEFNKSQDKYEVIPLSVPSGAADSKFFLAVAGGAPPDVMAQWNPVIPYWADSKLLQPLDQIEELDDVIEGQQPPVVQVGRGVLDTPEREGLDGAIGRGHPTIDHLRFEKALALQVVHEVVRVVWGGMANSALGLAEEQVLPARFGLYGFCRIEHAVDVQLRRRREVHK